MEKLFNPTSIAIYGASNNPSKAGSTIVQNLIKKNFQGIIYPIHPTETVIHGIKAYESLNDLPEKVDLVVLAMPARLISQVMEDLEAHYTLQKDIAYIVVAAADFAETHTEEGIKRQQILMDVAKRCGIRVMGPNCIGVINNARGVDTTFVSTGVEYSKDRHQGGISFISQSGSVASSVLMLGDSAPVPMIFNKFISIGNMADLDFIDFLEYLENDESTRTIGLYMEGYGKGKQLIETLARIARKKPIVIFKVGRSKIGSEAAASHTGSMAGSDDIYTAAFKQFGIVQADTFEDLFDCLRAFDELPLPKDKRTYIYSQTGGFGTYTTDMIEVAGGIDITDMAEASSQKLKAILPTFASVGSPKGYADITVAATAQQHVQGLKIVLDDPNISSVLFITVLPSFVDQEALGQQMVDLLKDETKPVYIVIMAGDFVLKSRKIIEAKFPTFDNPIRAVRALSRVNGYVEFHGGNEVKI